MIVKKVKSDSVAGRKAGKITALTNYVRNPENENKEEKCTYHNALGFISDNPKTQTNEMISLSKEAQRSKDPINHYILSWKEGEHPTKKQIDESVKIFIKELGIENHQVIYGLHTDTNNEHLHIVVNRIHPDTLKPVRINNNFDLEAAHRAIARIEFIQGWEKEKNSRYEVLPNNEIVKRNHQEKALKPDQQRIDKENKYNEKSVTRIAIEKAAPLIKSATSWKELHEVLANENIRYERTGSGATIFVDDIGVRASSVDRSAGFNKLQQRLGPFKSNLEVHNGYHCHRVKKQNTRLIKPLSQNHMQRLSERRMAYDTKGSTQSVLPVDALSSGRRSEGMRRDGNASRPRESEPLKKGFPGWDRYIEERDDYFYRKDKIKNNLQLRHKNERENLSKEQKMQREERLKGSWKGRGREMNIARSILASAQASEKISLKERQKSERNKFFSKFQKIPSFEEWYRIQNQPKLAEKWRYREYDPQEVEGERYDHPKEKDIRSYTARAHHDEVLYSKSGSTESKDNVSFIDKGRKIHVYHWKERETVLAALQLSSQKWGSFKVNGTDEYKELCVQLAAEYGFKIINEELRKKIEIEREKIFARWKSYSNNNREKEFEKYHAAIFADRYSISAVKKNNSNEFDAIVVTDIDGITRTEVVQSFPETNRLNESGYDIFFTPLSEDRHHIIISKTTREKLTELLEAGFSPSVILENSLSEYEVIINVPKLQSRFDYNAFRIASKYFNDKFGIDDVKLKHHAPGYKSLNDNETRIIEANNRTCSSAFEVLKAFGDRLQSYEVNIEKSLDDIAQSMPDSSPEGFYIKKYREIKDGQKGIVDQSRIDSEVAMQMRLAGYTRQEIEGALEKLTPIVKQNEEKKDIDFNEYASRIVKNIFSSSGDRQYEDSMKFKKAHYREMEKGEEKGLEPEY